MHTTQAATTDPATRPARGLSMETWLYVAVAVLLAGVIAATVTFGAVGLAMCALALVPVCYTMILLITLGS
ncbi:hypothetical protein AL035_00740 [Salipiger aestuarii]|uniref:Uncharacterized protein n=1 Tax=Salipiger aestuarii TaxID=568098 RepID=A0A327YTC2_9RHOB|nr:hypothetical protein [Salipiger aestuarii]KAB2543725.1 hypothetical protein AL035_00740 [Salipiger aestuarii]RAK22975.1 hypothetical protein ATI53_1002154 [Salipiger aestuarii]